MHQIYSDINFKGRINQIYVYSDNYNSFRTYIMQYQCHIGSCSLHKLQDQNNIKKETIDNK